MSVEVKRELWEPVGNASRIAPLRQITFLELQGPCCRNPATFTFLSLFPNLTSFSTYDLTEPTSVSRAAPVLERILLPQQLSGLRVASLRDYHYPEDISSILPRFSSLVHLDLGMGVFNNRVFDLLNHKTFPHLKSLVLRYEVSISDEQLSSLISGPQRLSKLEELDLWLILENEGEPQFDFDFDSDDEEIDEEMYYRMVEESGWEPGPIGFKDKLTAQGLEEAVKLADREGLKVTGYAAEWAREQIESRKSNGGGKSDYELFGY